MTFLRITLFSLFLLCLLSACSSHHSNAQVGPVQLETKPPSASVAGTSIHPHQPTPISEPMQADTADATAAVDRWDELRAGFQFNFIDNDRIRQQRNWYAKHPSYWRRVSQRAQPYLAYIHQQVQQRGMPAEFVLLPIVESAFDPFAYSHGRAAGLWQFIPATGKRFGLQQDWWYDGRRDVVDSTRAALDYLQHLHKRFDADWLLALAAYNSGEGTVSRAQRRNRKLGKPTGYWDLRLPKETRAYVPKLIALRQLVEQPQAFGITLEPFPDEVYFASVATQGQIDLAIAAQLAGIDLDQLYRLNPGFNRWATAPQGPHRLLVPKQNADRLRVAIENLPAQQRLRWVRHKIQPGQTLSHIAQQHQTTLAALRDANQLSTATIRAGTYLMVPIASSALQQYELSAPQRLHKKQNARKRGKKLEHIVRPGDTFWELSREYNIKVRHLAAWNNMAPRDLLRVGQKLVIWVKRAQHVSAHPADRLRPIHYTIRKGDSLSRIAQRFKVSVTDLRKWNRLSEQRYIKTGQKLKLYVNVTQQSGI